MKSVFVTYLLLSVLPLFSNIMRVSKFFSVERLKKEVLNVSFRILKIKCRKSLKLKRGYFSICCQNPFFSYSCALIMRHSERMVALVRLLWYQTEIKGEGKVILKKARLRSNAGEQSAPILAACSSVPRSLVNTASPIQPPTYLSQ